MAVISPGPDMAMTMRNSLLYSRRAGVFGALGTTAGMCMHLTYTVLGLGYIVSEMPMLLNGIRLLGAAYLIYIGYKSFVSKDSIAKDFHIDDVEKQNNAILTPFQAFKTGFFTNALNPMVILLFIGILSSYVDDSTPKAVQALYAFMMISISLIWFSLVAVCFSQDKVRTQFLKLGKWLERITGGALIAFGLKVAYLATRPF